MKRRKKQIEPGRLLELRKQSNVFRETEAARDCRTECSHGSLNDRLCSEKCVVRQFVIV